MFELPVSGWQVRLRALTGAHESMLLDTQRLSEAEALAVIFREIVESNAVRNWEELPISDADVLVLHLRRETMSDSLQADAVCPQAECNTRIDLSFEIGEYLQHHAPQPSKRLTQDEDGWWCMDGTRFRAPTLSDEIVASRSSDPARTLKTRCLDGAIPERKTETKIETALEKLAPSLTSALDAQCPECGEAITLTFDPRMFVLRELREQAAYLDNDIHLLASAYHWGLGEILDLPRTRRIQFAERVRADRIGGEA